MASPQIVKTSFNQSISHVDRAQYAPDKAWGIRVILSPFNSPGTALVKWEKRFFGLIGLISGIALAILGAGFFAGVGAMPGIALAVYGARLLYQSLLEPYECIDDEVDNQFGGYRSARTCAAIAYKDPDSPLSIIESDVDWDVNSLDSFSPISPTGNNYQKINEGYESESSAANSRSSFSPISPTGSSFNDLTTEEGFDTDDEGCDSSISTDDDEAYAYQPLPGEPIDLD